jgi:SOS response regulatory protein OraA/RecX
VIAIVERAGLVDDARLAVGRAETLARRGYGDAAILADLERRGVPEATARESLVELEPERVRACRLVASRGGGHGALRLLATRGFADDVLEELVAVEVDEGLG